MSVSTCRFVARVLATYVHKTLVLRLQVMFAHASCLFVTGFQDNQLSSGNASAFGDERCQSEHLLKV